MKNPNIKTRVVHSQTKTAWNVVGVTLGEKYKIAQLPYVEVAHNPEINEWQKNEAYEHAQFISECFNRSDAICRSENE